MTSQFSSQHVLDTTFDVSVEYIYVVPYVYVGFLNNSARVHPIKLKISKLYHMNNTFDVPLRRLRSATSNRMFALR